MKLHTAVKIICYPSHTGVNVIHSNKSPYLIGDKIRTICHARDLWTSARYCKQLRLLCAPDPWHLWGTALLGGFQSFRRALKPTEYDRVGQYFVSVDLFGIKDMYRSQMTVNLKSILCVGAVKFFPTVSHWFMIAITTTNGNSCKTNGDDCIQIFIVKSTSISFLLDFVFIKSS